MKTRMAMLLAAGVLFAAAPAAQAGQRAWARAGRVLTGYVLLRAVVGDGLWPVTSTPARAWACPRASRTVTVVQVTPRRRVRPAWPPPEWAPERWQDPPARSAPVEETEPIVVPLPDGRRLYQPAEAGSPAYVQTWSESEDRWVSVARMPPLR